MALLYSYTLTQPEENQDRLVQNISVGSKTLQFTFQWASTSQEQYDIIMRFLTNRAIADPLILGDTYVRDYDYLDYYMRLSGMREEDLEEWLAEAPPLPKSISLAPRVSQLILLKERIAMCEALQPTIDQYQEVLRWSFKMRYNEETNVGVIEPGGWYRNQDPEFSFRFVSDLPKIQYKDLGNVTIEFEVYDGQ